MRVECNHCGEKKTRSEFYIRKRKGKDRNPTKCKECEKKAIRKWRVENPEALKKINKRAYYKYRYGLEVEKVKKFGVCPICSLEKRLVVDHCHSSGLFRDFICNSCNVTLGHIENKEKLKRFLEYVEEHREKHED